MCEYMNEDSIQAYDGDILVGAGHHNEVCITKKSNDIFCFLMHIKVIFIVYSSLLSMQNIFSKNKYVLILK